MMKVDDKKEKFKQGVISIFTKWSAFRLTLDENPKVLTYINEDTNTLEINDMLEMLYGELYSILSSKKYSGSVLQNELADSLATFIEDYFQVGLEDGSDMEIAVVLIDLYNDIEKGGVEVLNRLKKNESKNIVKYSIDFPILGNQKVTFKKIESDSDEEDDENEEEEEEDVKMKDASKKNEPDEDGFIEVTKKRRK